LTVLLRDLPPRGRWYIRVVVALGALLFVTLVPRATLTPVLSFAFLAVLSVFTAAFKVQFPITTGSNMSVSYVVDIASILLWGPHAAMIVGAASGWSQTTLNWSQSTLKPRKRNPKFRTLFNMAMLVITVEAAGQVFQALGGSVDAPLRNMAGPLMAMAFSYFLVNTIPLALAIALSTNQHAWLIWRTDFLPNAPSYLVGAAAAAIVIKVVKVGETSVYALTLLLAAPIAYLTYKIYRQSEDSKARQGAILEAAQDAIITMDHELNIREFNPAAEQLFGYARLDILGRHVRMLMPPADRAQHLSALDEYLTSGRGPLAGSQMEMHGLKADGSEFPMELTVAVPGTDSRDILTAFARDITERRALEEQLRQSQKLEAIGRLAGGVAHDFNNILMSIMGAAELLLMQLERDNPACDEANEIKQAVERGAGLTRQLLAFSRRQARTGRLFALDATVAGMETMLRRLIGPEIDFRIVRPSEPVMVFADSSHIEQVLLNLVVNSRDAMPEGGHLTVTVDEVEIDPAAAFAIAEAKPGRYARLSVADTGCGMDEHTRGKLFEPFFTTKEQGKGTGLGLPIVYGIVKQSNGYIIVESQPGRGATFFIYLPIAPVRVAAPAMMSSN